MKLRANKNNGMTKFSDISIEKPRSESTPSILETWRKRKPTEQVGRNRRGGNRLCIRRRSSAAGRVIDFHGASSLVNHKSKLTPIITSKLYTPARRAGTDERAAEQGGGERGGHQASVSSIPRTRLNGVANRRHWKVSRGVIYPTSCRRLPTGRGCRDYLLIYLFNEYKWFLRRWMDKLLSNLSVHYV